MSDRILKVAVIGCGKMGMNHIKIVSSRADRTLVAIVDTKLDSTVSSPGIPDDVPLFSSTKQMYEAVKPDIVHIVTPPASHADLAIEAMENGAHVYVEKPFSLSYSDTERVLSFSSERGSTVCAGHQLLFHKNYNKSLKTLSVIGKPVHIESFFSFRPVRRISPIDQLIDILPHPTYTLVGILNAINDNTQGASIEIKSVETTDDGEAHVILRSGNTIATLVVSLQGRPVDSYLKIVGSNGTIHTDFILSGVTTHFGSGATAVSVILKPFSESIQRFGRSTKSLFRLLLGKEGGYSGLPELIDAFHDSVRRGETSPVSPQSILLTTRICDAIISDASKQVSAKEKRCAKISATKKKSLPKIIRDRVLVTGSAGFLGRVTCEQLRNHGWNVVGISRRELGTCDQVPGVKYITADLADGLPEEAFQGVSGIVHLAAETAGNQADHERNTIYATKRLLEQAIAHGIRNFINISSVAVLKPSSMQGGIELNEASPIDHNNLSRGPYVWAKAEAESLVDSATTSGDINGLTIRLGPLVDFSDFHPPGRLGREVGPWYVGVGKKNGPLSVCDVSTAADVIEFYLLEPDSAPRVLNLLDPKIPTRRELAGLFLAKRPDLKLLWIPNWLLRVLSLCIKGMLKLRKPSSKPLDVYAAFSAEPYDVTLASKVVNQARSVSREPS